MSGILILLIFISYLLFIYQLFKSIFDKKRPIKRIENFIEDYETPPKKIRRVKSKFDNKKIAANIITKKIEKSGFFKQSISKQKILVNKSNISIRPEEYIAMKLIVCIFGILILLMLFKFNVIGIVIGFAFIPLIWVFPDIIIRMKINNYTKKLNEQLGDALKVISNSLKAGHSFFQAIDSMVDEIDGPVSIEFRKVLNEIKLGESVDYALQNLSKRVESVELGMVIMAVLIQRQSGGSLSTILENISETLRARIQLKRELSSSTAQAKMSAIIICALPVLLFLYTVAVNKGVYGVLLSDPIGNIMLIVCIFMELIGIFFIRRIINVKI